MLILSGSARAWASSGYSYSYSDGILSINVTGSTSINVNGQYADGTTTITFFAYLILK